MKKIISHHKAWYMPYKSYQYELIIIVLIVEKDIEVTESLDLTIIHEPAIHSYI